MQMMIMIMMMKVEKLGRVNLRDSNRRKREIDGERERAHAVELT